MSLTKKKHDIRIFGNYIRPDSEKGDIEKNQKITFLLISANKDSLCSGIHFHEMAIFFYNSLKFEQNHGHFS